MSSSKKIKANEVTLIDGSTDIVIGDVRLFNVNEGNGVLNPGKSYFNSNNVLSVKPIDIEVCPNCNEPIEVTCLFADGGSVALTKHCTGCSWSDGGMNKPLLVIEVQDMNSVPTVIYNGETIEGKVSIAYKWETSGFEKKGKQNIKINHVYHDNHQLVEKEIKEEKVIPPYKK
ncbi:hypothetical protein BKK39_23215 [Bacillus cereus]|uniref:hypothetical protein n=1 Tax=Bacillus paranthracis TaxID=2026186 RepID=UPI00097708E6|nr:hypothetical protein BKK39_23215 [Bacillus cereus]